MQTNHVDSTGGIRNYPILGRGEGRGVLVAVVVWRADLYPKEVLQLSNPCFNGKLLTKILLPSTKTFSKTQLTILWLKVRTSGH